jgi:UDP-N-acetylglucosamine--N-acetylmuramyl-(pentapeptide) pyrophosphoryl-undecaprenol N-acetylglucosamine transferase
VNPDAAVTQRTILFAGGGSGGHLYPAITVARLLLQRGECDAVVFLTSTRAIDAHIMSAAVKETPGIRWIPGASVPTGNRLQRTLALPASVLKARHATLALLRELRPLLCVGIGAYASVAASLVCARRAIPLVLLEQNVVPGQATCFLSRYARLMLAGLPIENPEFHGIRCPVITTGVPVRPDIASLASGHFRENIDRSQPPHLLILGGSQGARTLNELAARAILTSGVLPEHWRVTHQTGEIDFQRTKTHYATDSHAANIRTCVFLEDMASAVQSADLVISRSGAGTLAELTCAGVASILVPHPQSARQHQRLNAEYLARAGAARIIHQKDVGVERHLCHVIRELTQDWELRCSMAASARTLARPAAAHDAANEIAGLIRTRSVRPDFG